MDDIDSAVENDDEDLELLIVLMMFMVCPLPVWNCIAFPSV